MEKLIHSDGCLNPNQKTKTSGILQIEYCLDCGRHEINPIDCDHEYKFVAFILANGTTIQLRKYCVKCHVITSKSESQTNHDMTKITKKNLEAYHEFYQLKKDESKVLFNDLIERLTDIKTNFRKDIYLEYLKSDEWKIKRLEALNRDNKTCQICGQKAEQVHHLTYDHFKSEYIFELVSLCTECHHFYYHPEKPIDYFYGREDISQF